MFLFDSFRSCILGIALGIIALVAGAVVVHADANATTYTVEAREQHHFNVHPIVYQDEVILFFLPEAKEGKMTTVTINENNTVTVWVDDEPYYTGIFNTNMGSFVSADDSRYLIGLLNEFGPYFFVQWEVASLPEPEDMIKLVTAWEHDQLTGANEDEEVRRAKFAQQRRKNCETDPVLAAWELRTGQIC